MGQLRVAPGVVVGFDMTAALAMAEALGIDTLAVAEFMPDIEAMMVRKITERMKAEGKGRG